MRLLADENVHGKVVAALRGRGYDVAWVKEIARSADDSDILARPDIGAYVFITNDRDFGDLILRQRSPAPLAVLYTRTPHRDWEGTTALLVAELERGVTPNQIATITRDGVRRRAFPTGVPDA